MASCGATGQLLAPSSLHGRGLLAPENQSESAWTGRAAAVTHSHWLPGTKHIHTERGRVIRVKRSNVIGGNKGVEENKERWDEQIENKKGGKNSEEDVNKAGKKESEEESEEE